MPESAAPLITHASGLQDLVAHLRAVKRFAFDTEFVSEDTYEPVLGLIQVATTERLVAIDTMVLSDIGPFWDVLTDPDVSVVMHAAGEDLRICHLRAGRLPENLVDVQLAAGLVGYHYPISLGNLTRWELGVMLSGGETRTDWRKRPLSDAQIRYGLDDVRHLLELADRLEARLHDLGRADWARAEYHDLLNAVERRCLETDRWRRLSGLHQLNRRGLEVARRLDAWRRDQARRTDRPLRYVLRDDLLVAIAKRQPVSKRDLEALREFNRPHLMSRSREILDLIADALRVPDDALPSHGERYEEGPGLAMVVSLLSATLHQACTEHRLSPALVGSSNDLKELIHWHLSGSPDEDHPALLSGWRGAAVGGLLLEVLEGRRSLRIVDPAADVPVALGPVTETDATKPRVP